MKRLAIISALLGFTIFTPFSLIAHHSVGSSFDVEQTVTFEGTVSKVEWFNPHIWIYISTQADDGSAVEYQCEGGSPNSLRRRGWSKDSVQIGDQVTMVGLKARADPYSCYTRSVKLMDGTQLFSGNAAELER